MVKGFLAEVSQFSKTNWWVYVIYTFLLCVVFFSRMNGLLVIVLISVLYFVADIFIMMMSDAYNRKAYQQGSYFQFIALFIFFSLKLYTGFRHEGWHYLASDPIYFLAAIKNYISAVKMHTMKYVNTVSMALLSIILLLLLLFLRDKYPEEMILIYPAQWVQTFGFFLFAIGLSTSNELLRYKISIVALSAMVCGSAWGVCADILAAHLTGLDLSYVLMPLTVLVFYLRQWPEYLKMARQE
jgi:hypothetical protein